MGIDPGKSMLSLLDTILSRTLKSAGKYLYIYIFFLNLVIYVVLFLPDLWIARIQAILFYFIFLDNFSYSPGNMDRF